MIDIINKILWAIATVFIVVYSLYYTFYLSFIQFDFKKMIKEVLKKNEQEKGLTPFQALMMTLGGRIGVGSIAGVALAIYIGGVGSLFWLFTISFFTAILAFAETVLGIKYRKYDGNLYKGGPSYYIRKGLGNKRLGSIYAIIIIISYIGGFLGIQANTIVKSLGDIILVPNYIIGIVLVFITSFIIFGGIKKIADVASKMVPFMCVFYLLIAIYVFIVNINIVPNILLDIMKSAFNFESFFGGFIATFIVGIQRGIFSNEAGLGTGSIAASTSGGITAASQGYIQMLGIYITSFIICGATAIIILTSNYHQFLFEDINGIEIASHAFKYHLGSSGNIVLFIFILLFSFSTILTGYYYGESSLKYFFDKINNIYLILLKIITLIILFIGSIMSSTFLWALVDILAAVMAIINLYALVKLKKEVKNELIYYKKKKYDKI